MEDEAVQDIKIDFPEASDLQLKFQVGPGSLKLRKGSDGPWVVGTYRDPSRSLPCKFKVEGGTAEIAQERKVPKSFKLMPKFDLQLGDAKPFQVKIEAGANEQVDCDFGGLPVSGFDGGFGAGMIRIDFGGALQRDCRAKVSAGVAAVEIHIPANVAAKITTHTSLGDLNIGDGFTTREGGFWTAAAISGSGPVLTIEASSAVGSLKLRTS